MKNRLFHSDKIEVRKSKIDGYGVFANEYLKKNELLELILDKYKNQRKMYFDLIKNED